jgi:protein-S-isoprenylcysteine O-methyltransferase Ste14
LAERSDAGGIAVNGRTRHDSSTMIGSHESGTPDRPKDASGAPVLPPAIVAIVMAVGWGIQWLVPLVLPSSQMAAGIALASTLAAMMLLIGAVSALRKAGIAIEPWQPSSALVTSGVFAVSRNPVYLAFLCAQAGFAWWLGIGWWLVLVPVSWFCLDRFQVRREERYLTRIFGKAYSDYQRRVGRWL